MKRKNQLRHLLSLVGSLHLTVIALLFLSVLVIWGTLHQVDHGVYSAQDRFFKAWWILIGGFIPFPAVKTVITVLSINLLAASFRKRPVTLQTAGSIILHIGVAVLIGGSALSSRFVRESAITLAKNQQTSVTYDFATWQLTTTVNGRRNGRPYAKIYRHNLKQLKPGKRIPLQPTDAILQIRTIHKNCSARMSDRAGSGIAALKPMKPSVERGRNFPGVAYTFAASATPAGDVHYAWAGADYPTPFVYGNDTIAVSIQPLTIPLPVRIELIRFDAKWHPGTKKAKSFQSRIRLFGKNIDREVVIEMNRPFRYKSFTFYQMGYSDQNGEYSSTLAIVKNPLRYLPYVASLIIVAGLFMHFFVKMWFGLSLIRGGNHRAR